MQNTIGQNGKLTFLVCKLLFVFNFKDQSSRWLPRENFVDMVAGCEVETDVWKAYILLHKPPHAPRTKKRSTRIATITKREKTAKRKRVIQNDKAPPKKRVKR